CLLGSLGFFLGDAFLAHARSAVNNSLGFFQAQAGQFAHSLDHVHFLVASFGQDDGEFSLLFSSGSSRASSGNGGSSSSNAELLFHCLDQFNNLHHGHFGNGVDDVFIGQSHDSSSCI